MAWAVRGSNPGGAKFSSHPDWPWDPPSLLYNGYRVSPRCKVRPGRAADHSPPSSAAVMEEESYTSTHPLGHNRACNGITLPISDISKMAESRRITWEGHTINMHHDQDSSPVWCHTMVTGKFEVTVKLESTILHTEIQRKANRIVCILHRNCLLKHVIAEKVEGTLRKKM